jgi:hypothetical protein
MGFDLSNNVDIEKYAQGWLSPVSVERLFADVLTKDSRFEEFKPEEIELSEKKGITASQVAGALSTAIIGIGWKKVRVPTTMVKFNSCPVYLGIFANQEDFARVSFVAPISSNKSVRDDFVKLITQIKIREDYGKAQIEYDSKDFPQLIQELRNDTVLSENLINLHRKGLIHSLPLMRSDIGILKYQFKNGVFFALTDFILTHKKKNWKNAIQQFNMRPEDFVENVFSAACSITKHILKYRITI